MQWRTRWRIVVLACAAVLLAAGAASAKVASIPVVATPDGLWVGTPSGEIVQLDATSGRVLAASPPIGFPVALASGRGHLWAIDGQGRRVVRISASGSVDAVGALPGYPSELAVGDTSVWAIVHEGPRAGRTVLLRIDPVSLRTRGRFHLGRRAAQLGAAGGRVWLAIDPVSPRGGAVLVAIDELRGELLLRRRLRGNVRGLSATREGIWALMERRRGSRLVGIDASTGTRTRIVTSPAIAGELSAGDGRVWVATLCEGPDCRIDRAAVRGYDDQGRLVAGPFVPWSACRRGMSRSSQLFLAGVAATPEGAAATTGDGRGRVRVALISEQSGVRSCPPVASGQGSP